MFCAKCGTQIVGGAVFCQKCGAKIVIVVAETVPSNEKFLESVSTEDEDKSTISNKSEVVIHSYSAEGTINMKIKVYCNKQYVGTIKKNESITVPILVDSTLEFKCSFRKTSISVAPGKRSELKLEFDRGSGKLRVFDLHSGDSMEQFEKMQKRNKKWLLLPVVAAVLFVVFRLASLLIGGFDDSAGVITSSQTNTPITSTTNKPVPSDSENEPNFDYDVANVFGNVLTEYISKEYISCSYALYDINANGVDELLVRYNDSTDEYIKLYTYANGKTNEISALWLWNSLSYNEDGNLYIIGRYGVKGTILEIAHISNDGTSLVTTEAWEMNGSDVTHTLQNRVEDISESEFDDVKNRFFSMNADFMDSLNWLALSATTGTTAPSTQEDSNITYFVEYDETISEEYQSAVMMYQDGRFSFCVNMGEGMGFYNGIYSENGDIYTFNVTETEFYGNTNSFEFEFTMRRSNDTLTYESEDPFGLTIKGAVFSISDVLPKSIAAARNFEGSYEGEDTDYAGANSPDNQISPEMDSALVGRWRSSFGTNLELYDNGSFNVPFGASLGSEPDSGYWEASNGRLSVHMFLKQQTTWSQQDPDSGNNNEDILIVGSVGGGLSTKYIRSNDDNWGSGIIGHWMFIDVLNANNFTLNADGTGFRKTVNGNEEFTWYTDDTYLWMTNHYTTSVDYSVYGDMLTLYYKDGSEVFTRVGY